jgi:hypothetical protein
VTKKIARCSDARFAMRMEIGVMKVNGRLRIDGFDGQEAVEEDVRMR